MDDIINMLKQADKFNELDSKRLTSLLRAKKDIDYLISRCGTCHWCKKPMTDTKECQKNVWSNWHVRVGAK